MSTIEVARPAAPERAVVTDADVLDRAADLLEEFGWCQGGFGRDANGRAVVGASRNAVEFCALGASGRACLDLGLEYGERSRITPPGFWMRFNDTPGRTKAEVVARLRDEAASLREAQA